MRPIGGEFEVAPSQLGRPRTAGPRQAASGRGALFQILMHIQQTRAASVVLLPDYLCGSVLQAVAVAGLVPRFYHVGSDLRAERSNLRAALKDGPTILLLISYFGLVDLTGDIAFARQTCPSLVIVKDDVQSPLEVAVLRGADFAFTSLRKSFPVVDGAPIQPEFPLLLDDATASPFALAKIAGAVAKHSRRYEPGDDRAFLALLRDGEDRLDDGSSFRAPMSWMSESALAGVDRAAMQERRRANFRVLEAAIKPAGLRPLVPLAEGAVPLFLPVLAPDRDTVREKLARREIYCPVHWPVPPGHELALGKANALYSSELSLVIDHRYDASDMQSIADALRA